MDTASAAAAAERTLKSAMHLFRKGSNALRELTDASSIQFIPTQVHVVTFYAVSKTYTALSYNLEGNRASLKPPGCT
jgi:hypothetical protein